MIVWDEPDEKGGNLRHRIWESEAIARQRAAARQKGYEYATDADALEDFLVVNGAWREEP